MMYPMEVYEKCVEGTMTREEAEKVIEAANIGHPAGAAYWMVQDCGSDRAWAERVIESATIGHPAKEAYWMVKDCGSDRSWAEKVIENATIGYPVPVAFWMVYECGSDRDWAKEVKANWEGPGPHTHEWIPHLRRDGTEGSICSVCDREK